MREPSTHRFPVLAILLAVACLGVPAHAVAQWTGTLSPWCYDCRPVGELAKCAAVTTDSKFGYLACELSDGGNACNTSAGHDGGPDCRVDVTLVGRVSLELDSEPWPGGVGGMALPRRLTSVVHLVDSPVARHGCSGAIVGRRYSSTRIAELSSGLRRVTI